MQYFFVRFAKLRRALAVAVLPAFVILYVFALPSAAQAGSKVYAAGTDEEEHLNLTLNAISACLMDADTGRVLYGKNENEVRAMASTTKIMTLIIILENAQLDDIVTVSANAAAQPDVQLNINKGEQYVLYDLLYSMMLQSHNDVAVALAEHVGGSVEGFANLMNQKAEELNLKDTYFITPNGLDASDEYGKHSTTAAELGIIASYAIQNEEFVKIVTTKSYSFSEVNGKRSFTVSNADSFLDMMNGAIGIKTGYTGEAGYCFVGALKQEGRTFVSVVLGSGWPPNKTYKWTDTMTLMQFGIDNYFNNVIFDEKFKTEIKVEGADTDSVTAEANGYISLLTSKYDRINVYYVYKKSLTAPVYINEIVGSIIITVNDVVWEVIDIRTTEGYEDNIHKKTPKALYFVVYLYKFCLKFSKYHYTIIVGRKLDFLG